MVAKNYHLGPSKYLEQTNRKEMQFFYCRYVKLRGTISYGRYMKELPFLSKMVYKKIKV